MKKEFTHIERKGLPGGPNEMFTYVTGVFSTEGYKRNSPDVSNPFNIIPSGSITMKDVDFPVMGTDNLGNSEMMMPGNDYQFPGDQVFEVPMAKKGGGLLTKTMKCNDCGWSWKAADGGKDISTCHKCGGSALPKAQEGKDIDNTYYTSDPNDPRIQMYQDSLTRWEGASKLLLSDKNITSAQNQIDDGRISIGSMSISPAVGSPSLAQYRAFLSPLANSFVFKKPNQPVIFRDEPKRPKLKTQTLDSREEITNPLQLEKTPEINVTPTKEPSWYKRTGFNSQPVRIQPSNYDKNNSTWRGGPFQKEYQNGGDIDDIYYTNDPNQPIQLVDPSFEPTTKPKPDRPESNRSNKINYNFKTDGLVEKNNDNHIITYDYITNEPKWVKGLRAKQPGHNYPSTFNVTPEQANEFFNNAGGHINVNTSPNIQGYNVVAEKESLRWIPVYKNNKQNNNKPLPKHKVQSLDKREGASAKQVNIEKTQEIEFTPKPELPWYQRTGFNSGLQRIQSSNYDPDSPTLRGEPFQMDMQGNIYQSGGSLPKAQVGNGEYTVESGNTFDGIANKLDIDKQALREANPGINYDELKLNQLIKLPKPVQKPKETSWVDYMNPMNWTASNRDDDGDFKQAFRAAREAGEDEFMWYGTRYSTDLKKTANKSQVQVEKTSDKLEPAKETKPSEGKTEKYTVKSGDTFDRIVNKKEVSKYFLKKVNPNVDYDNLNVGQVINLPDKKKDTLGVDEIENYLTITNGQTPDFWKSTADTIAFHESGPWQSMDPEAIQKSQNKKTGNFFEGPGEGVFQIETERAGGKNSFKQFKNRYESVADKLNMYADPKIINASRPIDLSLEEQYALFYTNLMEEPNVILNDYAQGNMSLIDLWLAGHKKVEKPGDRDAFRTSVERLKEEKTIFKKSGGEVDEFQVYANYINGSYNGTEMETKAEKIYDKLNRVYYRKAKALDMSAPNYIMSNIINRSGQ